MSKWHVDVLLDCTGDKAEPFKYAEPRQHKYHPASSPTCISIAVDAPNHVKDRQWQDALPTLIECVLAGGCIATHCN